MDHVIEKAESSLLPEILCFLHKNFDKEETMIKSMRENASLTDEEKELMRQDHERLIRAVFERSPCLVAIHKESKKVIGVNLMILSKRPGANDAEEGVSAAFSNNQPRTSIVKEYFEYLSDIGERANLYEKFPRAEAALEFYAVAVDKEHRRKGLARTLMAEGISYAKSLGNVGFVFGVYTSVYSKKAAENLGLKSYLDVDLLTYKRANGEAIFQDTRPHNIVSAMALEI